MFGDYTDDPVDERETRLVAAIVATVVALAFIGLLSVLLVVGFGISKAFAGPSACGPVSVGTTATAVTFPASGATGPGTPSQYLTITNPSATATLWVNAQPGGTAAANAAGSIQLIPAAGAYVSWWLPAYPPPASVSVIASAPGSPMTCNYQ